MISYFIIMLLVAYIMYVQSRPSLVDPTLHQKIGQLQSQLQLSRSANSQAEALVLQLNRTVAAEKEAYAKLLGQKKSSEVKTGQTVEQLIGFLDQFPYPNDEIKSLFQPIDLIVFREDEIVFIEVKSGEAQLSDKQRKIRKLIDEKKVRFEVHRVNGKGYVIK